MSFDKHEVLLRLRAIELLALWEGRVITNHIVDWFGVSRQQASIDIKRYINDRNPGSMVYKPSEKGYIPKQGFKPVLTNGHVNDYLELISGVTNQSIAVTLEAKEHFSAVQLPDRSVKPEVLRSLLKACRLSMAIKITYASMNNPNPHQRVISPHALIYTGFRWHVRAYCHLRNQYRDFVLSRITSPAESDEEPINRDADKLWNESITIKLVANNNLTPIQQKLVELDYAMTQGALEITVRKALVHYTLQRFQAAITNDNRKEVHKYHLMVADDSVLAIQGLLF
ncbi:MAG: WYL domain-containing protein [Gammaproteobacteria bacterium]|nr:WYL domain-containing protein [Gammaproteobacteria bacterium]